MTDQPEPVIGQGETVFNGVRLRIARRQPPSAPAPLPALLYLGLSVAIGLVWVAPSFADLTMRPTEWGRAVLVLALALAFEEGAARAARLRMHFGKDLTQDLTSVWSFGAVISLPRAWAVVVVAVIFAYTWSRHTRRAGIAGYRAMFNATNAVLSCLSAGAVLAGVRAGTADLPAAVAEALAVLAAMFVYAAVNRGLVTIFLICRRVPLPDMRGTRDQNLIEFATLCLGGLGALAVVYQPILTVLVIAPMVALQRGARLRAFETAASTDPKTGLLNAVAWEQTATAELTRATRSSGSLGVLIMDLDRFKQVNDIHGHLVGDKVLKAVGHALQGGLREYDTVGRFGGEEFVAVLPDADDAGALVIAERLRSRVNQLDLAALVGDPTIESKLSISIGVAVHPVDGDEVSDLLREADAALYRAKDAGRNRVVLADRGTGESVEPPVLVD